jgi:rare lipoprotein A
MYDPTIAASNSHPMGTRLRVVSLATGKSVIVRVTDTGAFRYPIVVDLSWAAFKQIANPDSGVVEVTVETLRD